MGWNLGGQRYVLPRERRVGWLHMTTSVVHLASADDEVMSRANRQRNTHRGVEQLVARRAHNPKVAGSSPVPATTSPMHESASGFSFAPASSTCARKRGAHEKVSTRGACGGLEVMPPLLDSRHVQWRNPVPAASGFSLAPASSAMLNCNFGPNSCVHSAGTQPTCTSTPHERRRFH